MQLARQSDSQRRPALGRVPRCPIAIDSTVPRCGDKTMRKRDHKISPSSLGRRSEPTQRQFVRDVNKSLPAAGPAGQSKFSNRLIREGKGERSRRGKEDGGEAEELGDGGEGRKRTIMALSALSLSLASLPKKTDRVSMPPLIIPNQSVKLSVFCSIFAGNSASKLGSLTACTTYIDFFRKKVSSSDSPPSSLLQWSCTISSNDVCGCGRTEEAFAFPRRRGRRRRRRIVILPAVRPSLKRWKEATGKHFEMETIARFNQCSLARSLAVPAMQLARQEEEEACWQRK